MSRPEGSEGAAVGGGALRGDEEFFVGEVANAQELFDQGEYFEKDEGNLEEALPYYVLAADSGHELARKRAINICRFVASEEHFQIAADLGDPVSQYHMGSIRKREGDLEKAFEYYQKSADGKVLLSMYRMAEFYLGTIKSGKEEGEKRVVEKDEEAADGYFKKIVRLYRNGDFVSLSGDLYEDRKVALSAAKVIIFYNERKKMYQTKDFDDLGEYFDENVKMTEFLKTNDPDAEFKEGETMNPRGVEYLDAIMAEDYEGTTVRTRSENFGDEAKSGTIGGNLSEFGSVDEASEEGGVDFGESPQSSVEARFVGSLDRSKESGRTA